MYSLWVLHSINVLVPFFFLATIFFFSWACKCIPNFGLSLSLSCKTFPSENCDTLCVFWLSIQFWHCSEWIEVLKLPNNESYSGNTLSLVKKVTTFHYRDSHRFSEEFPFNITIHLIKCPWEMQIFDLGVIF